jgi:hypothetical protein
MDRLTFCELTEQCALETRRILVTLYGWDEGDLAASRRPGTAQFVLMHAALHAGMDWLTSRVR